MSIENQTASPSTTDPAQHNPFFAWWCSLTMGELDQIELVANVDAARAGWNAAKQHIAPDPAVEPSDLVAAGDAMFKALKAIQADLGCGCGGEWGTCKQCTHDNIEAQTAVEAWEEAKKESENKME